MSAESIVNVADSLRGSAMIVTQHAAESFATFDLADRSSDFFAWDNDLVGQALMISFGVIMVKVRVDGIS